MPVLTPEELALQEKLRGTVDLTTWATRMAVGLSNFEEEIAPGVKVRADGTTGNFTLHWRLASGVGPEAVRVRLPKSSKGIPVGRISTPTADGGTSTSVGKSGWSAPDTDGIVRLNGKIAQTGGGTELTATAIVPFTAFSVTNTNDSGAGSLRQAIADAIADTAGVPHVITVSATGTLTLQSGLPNLTVPITFIGPGADLFTVRKTTTPTLFVTTTTSGFSGITVADGTGSVIGGALNVSAGDGVAINGCSFINNNSAIGGGINLSRGNNVILNSTFSGNSAGSGGGAIFLGPSLSPTLQVINCTFSGNSGRVGAGGIQASSALLTVRNCTFSGNLVTGGSTTVGRAINFTSSTSGSGTIGNSVFDGPGPQIITNNASLTSVGGNVSVDSSGPLAAPGDRVNATLNLGPLANNGGPTFTHALLAGSQAIDAGNNALVTNPPFSVPPFFDQRGTRFPRIAGSAVDAGAFEVQSSGNPINVNGSVSVTIQTAGLDVPTCTALGYANDYVITGTMTNISTVPVTDPGFVVSTLRETSGTPSAQPYRLISADGASCSSGGLVGARQSAGPPGFTLQPGQSVQFTFRIALFQIRRFKFEFNVEAGASQTMRAAGQGKSTVQPFAFDSSRNDLRQDIALNR